ncbi:MAG TPA: ribonuclease III [Gammaproteobacteria bacterium]|nr:ribonuclease III [Gammaproteobacteria bacterium]
MEKSSLMKELSRKLGYSFNDNQLLKIALTHRSSDNENNERLEFLGDSIVNFVIAEALFQQFTDAQEGDLSRWRATLINRDALGELARGFDLGRYLFLGAGELKSGGGQRPSILSCTMEAIIGAIYLDGGFSAVKKCLLRWYEPLLQSLSETSNHKDPKTQLQEYLQSHHISLPIYTVESVEGEAHQQIFVVSCYIESLSQKAVGKGTSRRRAEQAAAGIVLGIIKQ